MKSVKNSSTATSGSWTEFVRRQTRGFKLQTPWPAVVVDSSVQRRREYFEASLMSMGLELEATKSVSGFHPSGVLRDARRASATLCALRRCRTTGWRSSKCTCRGTCCAPTPRSCTSSCPSSPMTCRPAPPRGASSPASPSTSTPTRGWSGKRQSTSPPPLRRAA